MMRVSSLVGCSLVALIAAGSPVVVVAQDANAREMSAQTPEIIVTARKREESLQDVPLSITALSAETIKEQGVRDLRDIINLTPGLSLSEFGSGTLNVPVIRGMTNLTGGAFAESNVATFYNGVYLQNNNLIDATFLDIERVEVIKGPVSALYGRNAYAGVINYVTARPSDSLIVEGSAMLGTRDRRSLEAKVSGPLSGDALKASLSGRWETSGGSWRDPVNGTPFGGFDKYAVQGALEAQMGEQVNVLATLFYGDDRFDQPPRSLTNYPGFVPGEGNCGNPAGAFQSTICGQVPDATSNTAFRSADPSFALFGNKRNMLLGSLETRIDLGRLQLKSLSSFTDLSYNQLRDQDGTGIGYPIRLVGTPVETVNLTTYSVGTSQDESISQELRATLEATDALTLTFGGFYNKYTSDQTLALGLDLSPVPAGRTAITGIFGIFSPVTRTVDQFVENRLEDKEVSAFGMVELELTEGLSISAEARRSKQTKLQNNKSGVFKTPFVDPDGPTGISGSWKFWSFRFGADYNITDDTLLYAYVAQGNKAGGFNAGTAVLDNLQYDPERNRTYEVGIKTSLFDNRVTFNLSAFYADLTSLQLNSIAADGLSTVIRNGGEADAYGFEAELSGRIADGVQAGVGLAYANPKFKNSSFINSGLTRTQCLNIASCDNSRVQVIPGSNNVLGVDLGGLSLPRQSDWQFNALLDVRRPLSETIDWTVRGTYAYESKQFAAFPPINAAFIGARHTLNGRFGIATENFTIEAFVENALDDTTPFNFGSGLNPANFSSPNAIVYGDRRTFGVEASFDF